MKSLVFSSLTAVRQGRKGYGIRYQPSTAKVRYARSASCLRHIAYSDFWEADHRVLPSKRHRAVGKESGQTNHIERFNCTLGERISPLVRKTLSFSKKLENHIGAIGVLCSPLQCILTCVGLPTVTIAFWDILPELATCRFAAIANDISHNLAGAAAKGNPNPALVRFFDDERP